MRTYVTKAVYRGPQQLPSPECSFCKARFSTQERPVSWTHLNRKWPGRRPARNGWEKHRVISSIYIVSLLGFLAAILGSVAAMTELAMDAPSAETAGAWVDGMKVMGLFAAWVGFVIGITALTIFVLKNLPV